MASGSKAKTVVAGIALVGGCVATLAASAYGATVAYLMGASAQAELDQTTPANPRLLIRNSIQQVMRMAPNQQPSTIQVEDDAIEVNPLE